jgi:hypothetical protein
MSEVEKNLNQVLEIEVSPQPTEDKPVTVIPKDAEQDFDYSRSNYYELIEKGNLALDGILEVAKESQHPRAYEVAANMMKNLSDMTDKLMLLQQQRKQLEGGVNKVPQVQVDKAVFVGSTADLLKKLKNDGT